MFRTIEIFTRDYLALVKSEVEEGRLHDRMRALFEERTALEREIRKVQRKGAVNAGRVIGFMQLLSLYVRRESAALFEIDAEAVTLEQGMANVEEARRKLLEQVGLTDIRYHYMGDAFKEFEAAFDSVIAKDSIQTPDIVLSWFRLKTFDMFTADYVLGVKEAYRDGTLMGLADDREEDSKALHALWSALRGSDPERPSMCLAAVTYGCGEMMNFIKYEGDVFGELDVGHCAPGQAYKVLRGYQRMICGAVSLNVLKALYRERWEKIKDQVDLTGWKRHGS